MSLSSAPPTHTPHTRAVAALGPTATIDRVPGGTAGLVALFTITHVLVSGRLILSRGRSFVNKPRLVPDPNDK
jgi:hypothetical protein